MKTESAIYAYYYWVFTGVVDGEDEEVWLFEVVSEVDDEVEVEVFDEVVDDGNDITPVDS